MRSLPKRRREFTTLKGETTLSNTASKAVTRATLASWKPQISTTGTQLFHQTRQALLSMFHALLLNLRRHNWPIIIGEVSLLAIGLVAAFQVDRWWENTAVSYIRHSWLYRKNGINPQPGSDSGNLRVL